MCNYLIVTCVATIKEVITQTNLIRFRRKKKFLETILSRLNWENIVTDIGATLQSRSSHSRF